MQAKRNNRLIAKVAIIGIIIAISGYLFHPEVGQFSLMLNGQPIADPLVRFAAVPTFLVIMGLVVALTMLLFMGIGVVIFLGAVFFALMICFVIAPYFWPVLVIIFLIIGLLSYGKKTD